MKAVAQALTAIIDKVEPLLGQLSDAAATHKPAPGKWSKKEILGHLIDSAGNNQQKFVRTILADKTTEFVGYMQDDWVAAQQYNLQDWSILVATWAAYNRQIAHIIKNVDALKLDNSIFIEGQGPFTLAFLMTDYVEHLKHHLIQIIPTAGLSSAFSMTPYS